MGRDLNAELAASADQARAAFDHADAARETAYRLQREVTRAAASAIRALHRRAPAEAATELAECQALAAQLNAAARPCPAVYWTGFVLDAQKEVAEAALLAAIVADQPLPTADQLDIETAPWLNGLAEAAGELRRYVLDELRAERYERAETLIDALTAIYDCLVGFDYPDAILLGLKRRLDMVRGVMERTLSDVATTVRDAKLLAALAAAAERADG